MAGRQYDFQTLENATVYDSEHNKIGPVGQVYLDNETGRPTFVTVKMGLFGTRETFVPVDATRPAENDLIVPFTKDFIKDAPNIEADGEITPEEEQALFRYYGGGQPTGNVPPNREGHEHGRPDARRDQAREQTYGGEKTGVRDQRGDVADDGQMVAHEERLRVDTREQEASKAHLRKRVRTETENVEVPVRREELVVEREKIDPDSAQARAAGSIEDSGDEEVITLREERPVVEKETVATEKVNFAKRTVQDSETVSADVRKEEIDVDDSSSPERR